MPACGTPPLLQGEAGGQSPLVRLSALHHLQVEQGRLRWPLRGALSKARLRGRRREGEYRSRLSTVRPPRPSPLTPHPPEDTTQSPDQKVAHTTPQRRQQGGVWRGKSPSARDTGLQAGTSGEAPGGPPPPPGATGMLPPEARDPLEKSGRACTAPPPPGRPALTRRDGYSMRARGRPPACDPEPAALLTQLDLASAGARLHASAKQSAESGSAGPNTATQPTATAPPPARRPPAAGAAPAATFLFWCGEGRGREADAPGLRHFRSPGPTNQKRPRVGGRPRPGVPPGAWRGPRAPTGPGPGDLKA